MRFRDFSIVFLRNLLLTAAIAGAALGLFGYVLAGMEGFKNGLGWGLILSLMAAPVSALGMIYKEVGGGYAGRISAHLFKEASEGSAQDRKQVEQDDTPWPRK